jgi:hypothetical protein
VLINTKSKQSSAQFKPATPGLHPATCVAVIGAGTHWNQFEGEDQDVILVVFELSEKQENGEPYLLLNKARFVFNGGVSGGMPSALDIMVEALLGEVPESLDLRTLIGRSCRVRVENKTSTGKQRPYAAIPWNGFQAGYPGMPAPKPTRTFTWFMTEGQPFPEQEAAWLPHVFGPQTVAQYVAEAREWGRKAPAAPDGRGRASHAATPAPAPPPRATEEAYWVMATEGRPPVQRNRREIEALLRAENRAARSLPVCKVGTDPLPEAWPSAADLGFTGPADL